MGTQKLKCLDGSRMFNQSFFKRWRYYYCSPSKNFSRTNAKANLTAWIRLLGHQLILNSELAFTSTGNNCYSCGLHKVEAL